MFKTVTRTMQRELPDRSLVVATFSVVQLAGNEHPYFSSTGELYAPHGTWDGAARRRNGREPDAGGQISLSMFPQAAPFIAMHLSTYPDGVPMHALANSQYHAGNGRPDLAAKLLRCEVDELPATIVEYPAFVDAQAGRWADEAALAFAWLTRLP